MPYRAHPVTIFGNLWRVMYLIVIPVLRGFLLALQSNLEAWLRGAWVDVLIFLLMLGVAVLRWWKVRLLWDDTSLRLNRGVIFSAQTSVPWNKIIAVYASSPFYLRPFGAARLRVQTLAGDKNAAITVLLRQNAVNEVLRRHAAVQPQNEITQESYVPRAGSVLALSLLNSNSLAGVVFIATLVGQSGRLLGNAFSGRLIGAFEEATRSFAEEATRALAVAVPPAAAAIALALLAGWALSFIFAFLRYKNLRLSRSGGILHIRDGTIGKQRLGARCDAVSYIDIRQSLTTKILGLSSLYIPIPGRSGRGDGTACVIPAERQEIFTKSRASLFPDFSPSAPMSSPGRRALMRFLAAPLCLCALIWAAMAAALWFLKSWGGFISFAGVMALIPAGLFLIVRIFDYRTGGLSHNGESYTLRYSKWLYFHTVVIHTDKIVQVRFMQSIFQRRSGACDVVIHARAGRPSFHRCRGINLESAQKLFATF